MECQAPNHRFNLRPIFATVPQLNRHGPGFQKRKVLNKKFIEIKEGISFVFEYN